MTVQRSAGARTVTVPTISAVGGGEGGVLFGLGAKQLAVAAVAGGASVMVVVGAVAAGAYVFLAPGGSEPDLDLVPAGADTVSYVNVDEAREDQAIRKVLDTWFEVGVGGPDSTEAALAEFENETGLDPEQLHHATAFSTYEESTGEGATEYSATILRSDWSEEAIVEASTGHGQSFEERTFMGHTLYEPVGEAAEADSWIAVLDDGTYVVGTEAAAKDVVRVSEGDAEALDGELREAFAGTREGYLQFATRVPREQVPRDGEELDTAQFRKVEMVSGAYYAKRNALGVEMRLHANNETAAKDIKDVTLGALKLFRAGLQNEELKSTLRDVEIVQQGTDVVVSLEESADSLQEVVRAAERQSDDEGDSARLAGVASPAWADAPAGEQSLTAAAPAGSQSVPTTTTGEP
jgi:hypothetical protein